MMENNTTTWTTFMDMSSGGSRKESFNYCFIEAPEEEAKVIFYNRFGHNPERVTCTCCGDDYSISESPSLLQATAYNRRCRYAYFKDGVEVPQAEAWISGKGLQDGCIGQYIEEASTRYDNAEFIPLDEYLKSEYVHVIYAKDIKEEERKGDIPSQGYVWID